MKQQYKEIALRGSSMRMIELINTIIDTYQMQGYVLSVRQLYYQLVARDLIPNTEQSYKRTASIINDGRLAGLIDWDAIEDRNRDIEMRTRWESASSIINACADSFHMDLWEGQANRVFVIVEKAALAGVLSRVCRTYDVPLLAARGYPSVSIVREMVREHFAPTIFEQCPVILHFGDHDPSGIDMTRDLRERIELFAQEYIDDGGFEPDVQRIALTMKQVDEKKPPPNPAKTTDSRFEDYMRKFGHESWELDALEPAYLADLVQQHIVANIDNDDAWDERKRLVADKRKRLINTALEYRKHGE